MPGTNFTELQAAGWENYREGYEDNIFRSSWFWSRVIKRKKLKNGGESIAVPLQYATLPVNSISAYSTVSLSPLRTVEAAAYSWKFKDVPITISHAEERRNADETSALNLLDERYQNAADSMREDLNGDAFSDGTGSGSLDLTGLAAAVADNPTTGTYGGINRATAGNSWWRNQYYSTAFSFGTDGPKRMSNMYNLASNGASHPDLIVCDQETLELYEQKLQGVLRLDSTDQADGDIGFRAFRYKGALMYFDEQCPGAAVTSSTGRIYFLNTRHMELWVDRETDMIQTPLQRLPEQPLVKAAHILWMGQLVLTNCERQGVILNIAE